MYSSSIKLILLLLTCLAGLTLARPIKGKNLSVITKRVRNPRHLRGSLIRTQKFSRRGVEDIFEPEADNALVKQLSQKNTKKKKVAANSPSDDEETVSAADDEARYSKEAVSTADDEASNDKETVNTANNEPSNSKEAVTAADNEPSDDEEAVSAAAGESSNNKERTSAAVKEASNKKKEKIVSEADTNEPDVNAESVSAASIKPVAVKKTELDNEQDAENNDEAFDAPFNSKVNPGVDLISKYNFRFEDTQPLSDGIEFLREQNQEGLQEEAEVADEEDELRAASLRAQTAQRVRAAVGKLP